MTEAPKARRSQLISTYGVGGLFPSENTSFMIAGLQDWNTDSADSASEPRLARSLQVSALYMPPAGGRRDVPVIRFPETQVCPQCRRIGTGDRTFKSPWNRALCNLCKPAVPLTPFRLVVACTAGHIGEFPIFGWLHSGQGASTSASHEMTLRSSGRTSSLADLVLECTCGVQPTGLDGSFEKTALRGVSHCRGERPWLGDHPSDDCDLVPRTVQRGASNVWFPAVRSAISIPPYSEAVARFVDREWAFLDDLATVDDKKVLDSLAKKSRGRFTVEQILMEARRRHDELASPDDTEQGLRRDEYSALVAGRDEDRDGSDFVSLRRPVPPRLAGHVGAVRKVTRLREVRALYGFSRLDAVTDARAPEFCRLSPEPVGWLPAIEVIGEGLFVDLDREKVNDWAGRDFALSRAALLQTAADRAAAAAGRAEPGQVDVAAVMVHTLAHVMIDQLSLDAGYPAASIRERLYVDGDMAAMLLYTATSDAAGSLGGLAAQADDDRLEAALYEGLHRLSWCSSDPVCIESKGSGTDGLNLAACHACVLVPETSCELLNVHLDRGLLFGTPTQPASGFLSELVSSGSR